MEGRPGTFADLLRGDDDALDLARAALAIAQPEFPAMDPAAYVAQLDAMALEVRERTGSGSAAAKVQALNRYLFEERAFRGDLEDYYHPQNAYLNRVLDRGLGIPITLSLVYLEVGQRLGLPVVGVGLPGHFIVKVAGAHEELLVDPFYRTLLTRQDCQKRLDAIYGGKLQLTEQFLRAVGKREVLARLLYNLKRIHVKADDTERALRVLDMLLALQPHAFEDLRDRGLLRYQAGRYAEALPDLRAYLGFLPRAADAAQVKRAIHACERLRAQRP